MAEKKHDCLFNLKEKIETIGKRQFKFEKGISLSEENKSAVHNNARASTSWQSGPEQIRVARYIALQHNSRIHNLGSLSTRLYLKIYLHI